MEYEVTFLSDEEHYNNWVSSSILVSNKNIALRDGSQGHVFLVNPPKGHPLYKNVVDEEGKQKDLLVMLLYNKKDVIDYDEKEDTEWKEYFRHCRSIFENTKKPPLKDFENPPEKTLANEPSKEHFKLRLGLPKKQVWGDAVRGTAYSTKNRPNNGYLTYQELSKYGLKPREGVNPSASILVYGAYRDGKPTYYMKDFYTIYDVEPIEPSNFIDDCGNNVENCFLSRTSSVNIYNPNVAGTFLEKEAENSYLNAKNDKFEYYNKTIENNINRLITRMIPTVSSYSIESLFEKLKTNEISFEVLSKLTNKSQLDDATKECIKDEIVSTAKKFNIDLSSQNRFASVCNYVYNNCQAYTYRINSIIKGEYIKDKNAFEDKIKLIFGENSNVQKKRDELKNIYGIFLKKKNNEYVNFDENVVFSTYILEHGKSNENAPKSYNEPIESNYK